MCALEIEYKQKKEYDWLVDWVREANTRHLMMDASKCDGDNISPF